MCSPRVFLPRDRPRLFVPDCSQHRSQHQKQDRVPPGGPFLSASTRPGLPRPLSSSSLPFPLLPAHLPFLRQVFFLLPNRYPPAGSSPTPAAFLAPFPSQTQRVSRPLPPSLLSSLVPRRFCAPASPPSSAAPTRSLPRGALSRPTSSSVPPGLAAAPPRSRPRTVTP